MRTFAKLGTAAALAIAALVVAGPGGEDNATAQTSGHSDWVPFVGEEPVGCTLTNGRGPCSSHHPYWAADFNIAPDTPVYAAGPGEVRLAEGGCAPMGGDGGCNSRAGNYVAIDHGSHLSRYIHLSRIADGIDVGTQVVGGQIVGYVGNSGTSGSGMTHLHYDEITHPISTTTHTPFGPMLACHGDTAVQYPDVLGTTDWQDLDWGTVIRNDGYECLGGVTPTPPPRSTPPPARPSGAGSPGGSVGLAFGDLDGDGRADLLIGAPGEDIGSRKDAGTTALVYGSQSGIGRTATLRSKKGLRGAAEANDMLGAAIATGDFDCDDRDDVAVGIPGENLRGTADTGAVALAYGTASGTNRAAIFYQGKWLAGERNAGDRTGAALASGDFNGDGCADLAVGSPGEDIGGAADAGAVTVIFGRSGGLSKNARRSEVLSQGNGFAGFAERGDHLGATLAAGDFDCDGYDDLAAGVPSESIDAATGAGAVSILYGSRRGLTGEAVTLYQSSGIAGILEAGDRVGAALAAGDFDNDGCADLAVGAPSEDIDAANEAGAVSVVFGSRRGLGDSEVLYQGGQGRLPGKVESGDVFGAALAAGDLDCDGYDELILGAPGEDIAGNRDTGWVGIVHGSRNGFGATASLYQGKGRLPGANEAGDRTGTALATGDIDGNGCSDLAIGAPGESIGSRANAGRALVVMGSRGGPSSARSLSQAKNLPGGSEPGDYLGGPGVWELLGLSLH